MRVAVLGCKSYPPGKFAGGIEVNVWETTKRLKKEVEFHILTMHGEGRNVYEIPYIPYRLTRTASFNLFSLKTLQKIHIKYGIDLIHAHESLAGLSAAIFKKITKIPVLLTMHTIDSLQPEWKLFRFPFSYIEKLAIDKADKVIVPSEKTQRDLVELRGLDLGKSVVIPNGVDLKKFKLRKKPTPNTMIFVGRLTESKNLSTLLRVMTKFPDYELRIVGDGPLENYLKRIAPSNVNFLGFRRDIPALLDDSEIFVLPSTSEGSPISLVEALAAGKPIVASEVGGVPEIIGDAGILVEPTESGLLLGIKKAIQMKNKLSKKAFERAKLFDWDKISNKIYKVYLEFQNR